MWQHLIAFRWDLCCEQSFRRFLFFLLSPVLDLSDDWRVQQLDTHYSFSACLSFVHIYQIVARSWVFISWMWVCCILARPIFWCVEIGTKRWACMSISFSNDSLNPAGRRFLLSGQKRGIYRLDSRSRSSHRCDCQAEKVNAWVFQSDCMVSVLCSLFLAMSWSLLHA